MYDWILNNAFNILNLILCIFNSFMIKSKEKKISNLKEDLDKFKNSHNFSNRILDQIDFAIKELENEQNSIKNTISTYVLAPLQHITSINNDNGQYIKLVALYKDLNDYMYKKGNFSNKSEKEVREICIFELNKLKNSLTEWRN